MPPATERRRRSGASARTAESKTPVDRTTRWGPYASLVTSLRAATAGDRAFLLRMVAAAADWRPAAPIRSVAAVLTVPELAHYAVGWPAPGERGLIAQTDDGSAVGAAWWRFFPQDDPGYGFVDPRVPEVSIGVAPEQRGGGIGKTLIHELIALARQDGLAALSLSVEPDNFAARLYRNLGFAEVDRVGGSVTMLLRFDNT